MGYLVELNTLLKLPKDFNVSMLEIGKHYEVFKEKERVFPLHIAMLLVDDDWTFYGYCVVHQSEMKNQKTMLTFEVLSLFSPQERQLYKQKFLEAAHKTGEV
ncbi:DUF2584 family protein [Candidatus Gottesmanbacteria bacterium]|nr:DUF2584 family protein [Candidatus Gottesmanbacteria bacterium]